MATTSEPGPSSADSGLIRMPENWVPRSEAFESSPRKSSFERGSHRLWVSAYQATAHGWSEMTISGRSELLALGLSLASLLVFLRATPAGSPQRRKAAAASAVLYALGCGAKKTAVLLPAMIC